MKAAEMSSAMSAPGSRPNTVKAMAKATMETIGDDLQMEYRMAKACVQDPSRDFFEGVRAALVDKDQSPKWNPPTLDEVSTQEIDKYFDKIVPPP